MSRKRLRILVLDDDRSITDLLADLLEPLFAITVANSFDEGQAALAKRRYDIFLCDYLVDGVASTAFLTSVAARHPGLRRVLMSGSPLRDWREMLARGVVVAALAKPFTLDELCAVIAQ